MPIYEYQCESCKQVHEIIQRISEKPLTTCPDCQGTMKKMISMSAFHLKGGGWYTDGYASAGGCSQAASCNGGNGGEAKTDSAATPAPAAAPAAASPAACPKGGACCAAGN